jgi:putative transposase
MSDPTRSLAPRDHREEVALFRAQIIGALARRDDIDFGTLSAQLRELAERTYRPPGSPTTRRYAVSTIERWYYRYRTGGLEALLPQPRSDRGRGRDLLPELRDLLLDIRRENRSASVPLILRTLIADGRLVVGQVSKATLRRLYREHRLERVVGRDDVAPSAPRLRWQAARPNALWHGDVCHGPAFVVDTKKRPLRIHAMLDDASRYVVALEAHHAEREIDMLGMLVAALRRHGRPDALYLDNGATYRGEALRVGCERLGVTLLHARPYDPQARGKMERFWRTLRESCLNYLGAAQSLDDVQRKLDAFLEQHYHEAPHASLLGKSPGEVWRHAQRQQPAERPPEPSIVDALTVHERRRVRQDSTLSLAGKEWQVDASFLAGRVVTVARSLAEPHAPPYIDIDGSRFVLAPVDAVANSRRKRPPAPPPIEKTTPFAPADALLRRPRGDK